MLTCKKYIKNIVDNKYKLDKDSGIVISNIENYKIKLEKQVYNEYFIDGRDELNRLTTYIKFDLLPEIIKHYTNNETDPVLIEDNNRLLNFVNSNEVIIDSLFCLYNLNIEEVNNDKIKIENDEVNTDEVKLENETENNTEIFIENYNCQIFKIPELYCQKNIIDHDIKKHVEYLNENSDILIYNNFFLEESGKKLEVFGTKKYPLFLARDISSLLNYTYIDTPTSTYVNIDNKVSFGKIKHLYPDTKILENYMVINKNGLLSILSRTYKINMELLALLEMKYNICYDIIQNIRVEITCTNHLVTVFKNFNPIPQYPVGKYKVDLYLKTHKIAIECDEHNHSDRNKVNEVERQQYIENKLGCIFYRFNPDSKDFSIFNVIRDVIEIIGNVDKSNRINTSVVFLDE